MNDEYAILAARFRANSAHAAGWLEQFAREFPELPARLTRLKAHLVRAGISATVEQESTPAPTAPVSGTTVPANGAGTARARAPAGLPDPGLTVVMDSGLAPLLGHVATLVWLCLLRHANGRIGRIVKGIGYDAISEGTGLSRQQVRDGVRVLVDNRIIERLQEGRSQRGVKLTAEYTVPYPTAARIAGWQNTLTAAQTEAP